MTYETFLAIAWPLLGLVMTQIPRPSPAAPVAVRILYTVANYLAFNAGHAQNANAAAAKALRDAGVIKDSQDTPSDGPEF